MVKKTEMIRPQQTACLPKASSISLLKMVHGKITPQIEVECACSGGGKANAAYTARILEVHSRCTPVRIRSVDKISEYLASPVRQDLTELLGLSGIKRREECRIKPNNRSERVMPC